MPDASKYNFPKVEKVQVFEHVNTYIEHNHVADDTLKHQIKDLTTLVNTLQTTYNPSTETEALTIIDAEFREIQITQPTRWQSLQNQLQLLKRQLLNPERHLSASKAALNEVAKNYFEDSVVAKAILTYLETMSEDPSQGE
jgi:chaperonin cofactor prefoldin